MAGEYVMLILRNERQGCIRSIQIARQNIKHGSFTLWLSIVFDFQCKWGNNGHIKVEK